MKVKQILKDIYYWLPFKRMAFSFLRFIPLPDSVIKHLHFEGVFKAYAGNFFFRIKHYGYQLENEIFWKGLLGGWEKTSLKIWITLAKQSEYIFDIGANTGLFSLVAKTVNEKSSVYAFEPVNRVYQKMIFNFELNNFAIHSEMIALSNRDGKALVYDLPNDHIYSVTVNVNKNPSGVATIPTEIDIMTLKTFFTKNKIPRIDLIKVDVETHEPEVLMGGYELFQQFKPAIIIEVLNTEVACHLDSLFKKLSYIIYFIDEKVGKPEFKESINCNCFGNFLVCTESHGRLLNL